jgi:hypothetical protein
MVGTRKVMAGSDRIEAALYTVVAKSGQRGTPYSDAALAALAFARASERDRPFVLRHRGDRSVVIANTRSGRKLVDAGQDSEAGFLAAFRSFEEQAAQRNRLG